MRIDHLLRIKAHQPLHAKYSAAPSADFANLNDTISGRLLYIWHLSFPSYGWAIA
jgi:hypothetical protein